MQITKFYDYITCTLIYQRDLEPWKEQEKLYIYTYLVLYIDILEKIKRNEINVNLLLSLSNNITKPILRIHTYTHPHILIDIFLVIHTLLDSSIEDSSTILIDVLFCCKSKGICNHILEKAVSKVLLN